MDTLEYLIAGIMVYISVTVFFLGIMYRIYRWRKTSVSPMNLGLFPKPQGGSRLHAVADALFFPQVLEVDTRMWVVVFFLHAAGLAAFVGHLRLLQEFTLLVKLLGTEGMASFAHLTGGLFGVILILTLIYLLFRRFKTPYKDISVPEDYILLVLLMAVVIMGDHLRFFADIPVGAYRNYIYSLLVFHPSFGPEIVNSPAKGSLVAHVLFANLLFIYFPFSKLMHFVGSFATNLIRRG
ncbi:MAG: respiratory nitrate reductase subunit gamma [Eubacteriales bacterium]